MTQVQQQPATDIISSIVINGDISKLTQVDKVNYYRNFCDRLGLDPLSQPFKLLKLNGKEVMYCDRSGAQQLNKLHQVSHEIKTREVIPSVDVYQVTARATLPDGRYTESIGAVSIGNLKGDGYANAIMKAETKAKRRATLDLLGLGMLDETEVETIKSAQIVDTPHEEVEEEIPEEIYKSWEKAISKINTLLELKKHFKENIGENPHPKIAALYTKRKEELAAKK
jgi:hypothetical protein